MNFRFSFYLSFIFLSAAYSFAADSLTFETTYLIRSRSPSIENSGRLRVTLDPNSSKATFEPLDPLPQGIVLKDYTDEWVRRAYLLQSSSKSYWAVRGRDLPQRGNEKIAFSSVGPELMIGVKRRIFNKDSLPGLQSLMSFQFNTAGELLNIRPSFFESVVRMEWTKKNMRNSTPAIERDLIPRTTEGGDLMLGGSEGPHLIPYNTFVSLEWAARLQGGGATGFSEWVPYLLNIHVYEHRGSVTRVVPLALYQVGPVENHRVPVVLFSDLIAARNTLIEVPNQRPALGITSLEIKGLPDIDGGPDTEGIIGRALFKLIKGGSEGVISQMIDAVRRASSEMAGEPSEMITYDRNTGEPQYLIPVMSVDEDDLDLVPLSRMEDFRKISKLGNVAEEAFDKLPLEPFDGVLSADAGLPAWSWALIAARTNFFTGLRSFSLSDLAEMGLVALDRVKECKRSLDPSDLPDPPNPSIGSNDWE